MFHEYAVEPQAIGSSWDTFRYVIEKFGFDKGRLISQFPSYWLRSVYQSTGSLPPMQKKRIEVALNQAKKNKIVRFDRPYDDSTEGWLENALTEHLRKPFHAIIAAANPKSLEAVVSTDDLDEYHALMVIPHECAVPRDVDSISAALQNLLHFGSRIVFVDPFFDPYNARYKRLLFRCMSIVRDLNSNAVCEVHYRYKDGKPTNVELERDAARIFSNIIPEGMVLTVWCWKEKDGGEDFHARYLLTEKGGVRIDAGFEPVGSHQTTDMALMDFDLSQTRLKALARDSNIYDLVDPVLQITSTGEVQHVQLR